MPLRVVKFLLLLACPFVIRAQQQVFIIPQPVELKVKDGYFAIDKNTSVQYNASQVALKPAVDFFLNAVKEVSGVSLQVNKVAAEKIEFILVNDKQLNNEAYKFVLTLPYKCLACR
jgi:hexosaminidase